MTGLAVEERRSSTFGRLGAVLLLAVSLCLFSGLPASAATGGSTALGYDLAMSYVVGTDPAIPVSAQAGGVGAPPDGTSQSPATSSSVNLGGGLGEVPVASFGPVATTAVSGPQGFASKAAVTSTSIVVGSDTITIGQTSSSVDCQSGKPVGTVNVPSAVSVNGTPTNLMTGTTQIDLPQGSVTIATTPAVQTATTVVATAMTIAVVIDTGAYTAGGTVSLARSSCETSGPPVAVALSPGSGPASGQTKVTITGDSFVPGQTTVAIGGLTVPADVAKDGKSLTFSTPNGAPGGTQVTVTTPGGTSTPLSFTYLNPVTTSGYLRDADTGAPLRDGCVAWNDHENPGRNGISWANWDGSWSFTSDSEGPFDLGFYVRVDNDCNKAIGTAYIPSWYLGKPMIGSDPASAVPADGSTAVEPGSSTVGCLSPIAVVAVCATPNAVISGRVTVDSGGPAPAACIFLLGASGEGLPVIADADGVWRATDLPVKTDFVVAVIPNFTGPDGPCTTQDGPPPTPPAGGLQPVFFRNVWIDLAALTNDESINAYTWAVEHGAQLVAGDTAGVDTCLSAVEGSVVPRPACGAPPTTPPTSTPLSTPASPTSSPSTTVSSPTVTAPSTVTSVSTTTKVAGVLVVTGSGSLAATGVPVSSQLSAGLLLVVAGFGVLSVTRRRRGQHQGDPPE